MGLIDSMAKTQTNKVGRQLTDARELGWLPWGWIVDETRAVEAVSTWADPARFADAVTRAYRRNKWQAQPVRVEVWSEKGTVRGTLAPVLDRYEVPFRVMHGFASATTVNEIAAASLAAPQPLIALYVGDWDPSGLHMSEEDLPRRLERYRTILCMEELPDDLETTALDHEAIVIERVALAAEDVADPALPSFSVETKRGDPRWTWFVEEYVRTCWELDALSPVALRTRVEAAIVARLDRTAWDRYAHAEAVERDSIVATVGAWRAISAVEPAAS